MPILHLVQMGWPYNHVYANFVADSGVEVLQVQGRHVSQPRGAPGICRLHLSHISCKGQWRACFEVHLEAHGCVAQPLRRPATTSQGASVLTPIPRPFYCHPHPNPLTLFHVPNAPCKCHMLERSLVPYLVSQTWRI